MSLWFTEEHTASVKLSIKAERQLFSTNSQFQKIEIFETEEFGKMLVMDDRIMLTEKDEFIYHEMLVHVPMAVQPEIKRVLVIGGGDGGILRELTRYDRLERVMVAEIDAAVVDACRKHLPLTGCGFDDPRVEIMITDGLRYVRSCHEKFDLIIVDSTDPFGPGENLFTREFYGNCYRALTDVGILVNQHESPYYDRYASEVSNTARKLQSVFPVNRVYQAHIPTYPSGHWLFGFSSKGIDPLEDFDSEQWLKLKLTTRYYNTQLHYGAFALPNYVQDLFVLKK